jgi:hypothetical protein
VEPVSATTPASLSATRIADWPTVTPHSGHVPAAGYPRRQ